ncbi:MAG: pyridoxamine 5'-phosphate oxidase family protein [Cyclobacteriaceae bacterium]|nr:pyridoxamine 5'-phosphate oxidase family protein [Cyclobacteriaceae bacterium]
MKKRQVSDRIRVKRIPERGIYGREDINKIFDETFLCHISFVMDGQPFIIPTAFGRKEDVIYIHGSSKSRMLLHLESGADLALAVTHVDGLVLAKSLFHHSMNYRSVVLYGKACLVTDKNEKMEALKIISEQILKGRWNEARLPNEIELKATTVLKIQIDEASAKVRTGPPGDDKKDLDLEVWSGILPMYVGFGEPIKDSSSSIDELPQSILKKMDNG